MRVGFGEDGVVGGGFPFVVVGFDVVLAHRVVGKGIPHEESAQVGMAGENDAEEVEDFALLEFAGTPDRGERRDGVGVGAIGGAQVEDDRRGGFFLTE